MPRLTIDQREVEVPPGSTVLAAARQLGIDVPTLCFLEGYAPSTSCLVCMVRIRGGNRLVPSCGTLAEEGMQVESETPEVHEVRRSALELLLSDHLGDCLAPCFFGCPAHMDISLMLRQIAAGDLRAAVETVKHDIALPAVLGRICPAPCEKVCRRHDADGAVAICLLKRLVADVDLGSGQPYVPPQTPPSGRRVAIVGGGPTGLAAAYYLAQQSHACTIFDENEQLGGRLCHETSQEQLPRDVLRAEIATLLLPGVEVWLGTRVGPEPPLSGREEKGTGSEPPSPDPASSRGREGKGTVPFSLRENRDSPPAIDSPVLSDLRQQFDAVLIACGANIGEQAAAWGLAMGKHGIHVEHGHFATSIAGVFAAGGAVRGKTTVVRSAADGKEAAAAIAQFLEKSSRHTPCAVPDGTRSVPATSLPHADDQRFSTKIGRMQPEELAPLLALAASDGRAEPQAGLAAGYAPQEGARQAARCLHCDCRGLHDCKLRKYAALYGANPRRYKAQRRTFELDAQHAEVLFEPGKCIDCGLCIQIAKAAGEPLGLTFVGRGFDVRVGVPLSRSLAEALHRVAAECVAACPTAALAWKETPSAAAKRRVAELVEREKESGLTLDERSELDRYLELDHRMRLAKARARRHASDEGGSGI